MTVPARKGPSRPHGVRASLHTGRRAYPDLSPKIKLFHPVAETPQPAAASWPAWTDRQAVETVVDPLLWPNWTDARFSLEGGVS